MMWNFISYFCPTYSSVAAQDERSGDVTENKKPYVINAVRHGEVRWNTD